MSQYQSKGGRRDGQHKKAGKSAGTSGSRKGSSSTTVRGGVAAIGPSVSKPSASSIAPAAVLSAPLSPVAPSNDIKEANGGSGVVPSTTEPNHGQTTLPQPKDAENQQQSGGLHPSIPVAKHSSATSEKCIAEPSFPLQFGSISPGFIHATGMQIPARTSSAPPNLDEQRRKQVSEKEQLLVELLQSHVMSHGPTSVNSYTLECPQVLDLCTQSADLNAEQESKDTSFETQKTLKSSTKVLDASSGHATQSLMVTDQKVHSDLKSSLQILYPPTTSETVGNSNSRDVRKHGEEHDQVNLKDLSLLSGSDDGHAVKIRHANSGVVASDANSNCTTEVQALTGSSMGDQRPSSSNPANVAQETKQGSKKKKKKELLAKADAAGSTADLYNAYKAPEDKKRDHLRPMEHPVAISKETKLIDGGMKPPEKDTSKEVDDWEDAAELPTPSTGFVSGKDSSQRKVTDTQNRLPNVNKYTRDFLLTFKDQSLELPLEFKLNPFFNQLLTREATATLAAREALVGSDRPSDRQAPVLHEQRASLGDEVKWAKPLTIVPPGGGSDLGGDISSTPTLSSARPVQNMNSGLLPRMHPGYHPVMQMPSPMMPSHIPGTIPSAHMMGIIPPPRPSGIDADRWQRALNLQKGLIPSPQTPLAAIHKAESRYEVGKISDEEEAKQRQIKSILNKLTPQNFDRLFEQVKEVKIEAAATLTGVISQIFGKALMEPTFCEMYAKFCLRLSQNLPEFREDGVKITFKRLLLNNCQEEFERGEREQQEAEKEEDGQITLTKEEREEKKVKARRRMLGNIRFIGELYKESMLTERIMHECIKKLLGEYHNPDEEDVEALCKLMTTIGRIIDHPKAKGHMDAYFERMNDLSNNKRLSSRLRFMLKDVIDLRRNDWQERRKVEGPKKIDEVHRDAAQERQVVSSRDRLTRVPSMGGSTRRPVSMNDFPARGHMPFFSPPVGVPMPFGVRGGIHAPYGQDYRMEDRSFMETRTMPMPLLQRPNGEGNVTLGPQGGLGRGYGVRNQPSVASARGPLSDAPPVMFGDSRRAGLGPVFPGTNTGMMPDRVTNGGRHHEDFSLRPSSADRMHLPAERLERPHTSDRYIMGSGRELRGIDRSFSDKPLGMLSSRPGTPPSTAFSHSVPMSPQVPLDEELIRKCKSTIAEYYSARDMKEAVQCVEDLKAPWFHARMVSIWVSNSLEKKESDRDLLVRLLVYMRRERPLVTREQLIQGFQPILSSLEDTTVDVPRAPSYIAGMMGKLVAHDMVSLWDMAKLLKEGEMEPGSLLESGHALNMLIDVLDILRNERGEAIMMHIYEDSGISLEDFVAAGDDRIKTLQGLLWDRNLQILCQPRSRRR